MQIKWIVTDCRILANVEIFGSMSFNCKGRTCESETIFFQTQMPCTEKNKTFYLWIRYQEW